MTNGIKALRVIQLSAETTQGVPTTDFETWRGTGTMQDVRETIFPEEDIGILGGTTRNYCPKKGSLIELDETPATFEQLQLILDSTIYKATPTTDASSAKIRTYTVPILPASLKSSTDLQTYSVKAGDNNEVEDSSFLFGTKLSLSGTAGGALMVTASLEGREVTTDADGASTSATLTTVEEILFSKGKLYIDANSATDFGQTLVSDTLIAATVNLEGLWLATHTASGRTDFSFIKMKGPDTFDAEFTFEHNATASAEKAYWRAGTTRLIQLKFEGSALSTTSALAPYDVKTLKINLPGAWESFDKIDEKDGNDIVVGKMKVRYDSVSGTYGNLVLVNERA